MIGWIMMGIIVVIFIIIFMKIKSENSLAERSLNRFSNTIGSCCSKIGKFFGGGA